ncbi:zf-CHY-domain-containing protein [Aspergillus affinis]|uniref:zf-CHY-domain-containing protein n=1 Tax=Aspergillus affinis TaxID=1070780 RepID=UPI0022FF0D3F|nr:zf-CHY-domain-containing protein [Aspergillus affinis]KAI9039524.1 zf-CHY-domain-containing protein [Aspergillus affinis]
MSGLISSLLIGPVVRQARRLSHPTHTHPPSDHDQVAPSPNTQDGSFSASNCSRNGNGCGIMSDLEDTTRSDTQSPEKYSGQDTGPSASPSFDVGNEHHESDYPASQHSRHDSGNTSLTFMDVRPDPLDRSHSPELERVASAPLSSQTPPGQRGPDSGEPGQNLDDRFYLYDSGGQSLLPEDDGMGILREKIHAIRDLHCGSAEKARMIHELMTADYNSSQEDHGNQSSQIPLSPSSPRSPERAGTPASRWSRQSFDQLPSTPDSTTTTPVVPEGIRYNLTEHDLRPTFHPKTDPDALLGDVEDVDSEELEEACLGCPHYKRNVKLQCFSCKKWYTCRFCHDEVEDHHLDRPKTENMLCMFTIATLANYGITTAARVSTIAMIVESAVSVKAWVKTFSTASQPMPAEFKNTRALVYCNDCGVKSVVKYHWLGLRCDMCESYNTAQIKLVQSDAQDPLEQEDGNGHVDWPRLRSSTQNADDAIVSTLASLRVETSSVSGASQNSRLSAPSSAEPNGRFSSYSLARGRTVSPVISNYFGIPPDRGPERSISTSLFGGQASQGQEEPDTNELRFWGKKFKYGYGLLGHEKESIDDASDGDSGEDESTSADSASEDENERAEDEEDEDDDEGIDIFGHR